MLHLCANPPKAIPSGIFKLKNPSQDNKKVTVERTARPLSTVSDSSSVSFAFFQDRRPTASPLVATCHLLMYATLLSLRLAERVAFPLRRSQEDVNRGRPRLSLFF